MTFAGEDRAFVDEVVALVKDAGGVGHNHARKPVLILVTEHDVTITDQNTGEILGTHTIEPEKNYWRNQTKEPGRWPGSNL